MAVLDLVDWPAERTLRVAGSPSSLRVPITLANASETMLVGATPELVELKNAAGQTLPVQSVGSLPAVAAGAVAPSRLRVRLDPSTPPGRYEGRIVVAGVTRALQIDIVETVALALHPAPLVIDLAAGRSQRTAISVENRGNVALTVDLGGNYPLGEELPLRGGADIPAERAEGVEKLLALLHPAAPRALPLREVGTISLAMPNGPARIEPGAAATVPLDLTLADGLAPTARYRAFIPLYDQDLAIILVTAAKSTSPAPKARAQAKGVKP